MKTAQKSPLIPVVIFGAICFTAYACFQMWAMGATTFPIMTAAFAGLALLLFFGVKAIWKGRRWIARNVGLVMFAVAVCIMTGCWFLSLLPGVIAGGFLAVSGAVLMLKK